jgi:uncharacterized integral membrane protein
MFAHNRTVSVHPAAASPAEELPPQDATLLSSEAPSPDPHDLTAPPRASRPRRTRVSAAWLGVCFAAIALVVLIVFMLQNTRSVEISFLWLHGNVPLALALLTAGVGVAVVAIGFGEARIGQLRRAARRQQ